jgi:peroxiredoxin
MRPEPSTARGYSCRNELAVLRGQGIDCVLAVSSDKAQHQDALVARFRLPYPMVTDPTLELADALGLPTFVAHRTTYHKRVTLIVRGRNIEHVLYPISPPDAHGSEVLAWLRAHPLEMEPEPTAAARQLS